MTLLAESWTVQEAALAAAVKENGIEVSPESPLVSLSRQDGARSARAPALSAEQRRALSAVCRPALGLGILLSPPHGLDLVWFFDGGKPGDPLVRYRIDAGGEHDFREFEEEPLLDAIRACLHLETPAAAGEFTLAMSAGEFQTLVGLADANREQSLRSLLDRLPDPERTFTVAEVWGALTSARSSGDRRWLTTVVQALTPFDFTINEETCARGLEALARRGFLEAQSDEWRLTETGRVLCAALAAPIAYAALHGRWAESSGTARQEHVAALRTLESLWLMSFQRVDSASPTIELRPVSGEEADLAFSERVFEWRRTARSVATAPKVPAGGRSCSACGAIIDAEARFCSRCGAPVLKGKTESARSIPKVSAAERRCPKCGGVVPANKKFCTVDGTRVP
jgi:RNA polymerase subunit RPABC4/transcription elongation factor Spt4